MLTPNIGIIVDFPFTGTIGLGKSYFIGNTVKDLVKLDLYYTDEFVFSLQINHKIRYLCLKEISAMKLEVIGFGGRKKDFWDIHELLETFTLDEMIGFHQLRCTYGHTKSGITSKLIDFSRS